MRRFLVVGLAPVLVVAAAGCGSSSSSGSKSTTSAAPVAASPTAPPAGTPPQGAVAIGVVETEYKLTPANIVPRKSGKHTILAMNKGKITHAIEIEGGGPGGKDLRSTDIAPGQSATITADLKAGKTYQWYCPIDGHKGLGMRGTIKIAGSSSSASSSSAKTSTSSGSSSGAGGSSSGSSGGGGSGY